MVVGDGVCIVYTTSIITAECVFGSFFRFFPLCCCAACADRSFTHDSFVLLPEVVYMSLTLIIFCTRMRHYTWHSKFYTKCKTHFSPRVSYDTWVLYRFHNIACLQRCTALSTPYTRVANARRIQAISFKRTKQKLNGCYFSDFNFSN